MILTERAAVITANSFNITLFTEGWLLKTGIVNHGDIRTGALFTPAVAQFVTKDCNVLAVPDRLQIVPIGDDAATHQSAVVAIGDSIVKTLPHTPYTSAGLNFACNLDPSDEIPSKSRQLFLNPQCPLASHFKSDDARFGAYFSKNFHQSRCKITILPAKQGNKDFLNIRFNYHVDITQDTAVAAVHALLELWDKAREYSNEVVRLLE